MTHWFTPAWLISIWLLVVLSPASKEAAVVLDNGAGRAVAFEAVAVPNNWSVGNRQANLVITDRNWSRHYSSPPPGADFANYIYIVASMGQRPNPGYRIRILRIRQQNEKVTISLERLAPERGKAYAQMMVTPIAVAAVKKADLQPSEGLKFLFTDQNGRPITTEGNKM